MKCTFQQAWLLDEAFSSWLEALPDKFSAYCKLCKSPFALSNMGRQAVISHTKGKKHIAAVRASSSFKVKDFFNCDKSEKTAHVLEVEEKQNAWEESSASEKHLECLNSGQKRNATQSFSTFLIPDSVTKAEILWCFSTVKEHLSFRSASRQLKFCKILFSDSKIAEKMHLGKTKIAYTITYGLGPHFKSLLLNDLNTCSHIVVSFDESFNKISQSNQMDLSVSYWDITKNQVSTRYLTSVFLGHSTAIDILKAFMDGISGIDVKKVVQVSMDGPNVNLKFIKLLRESLQSSPIDPVILEFGSCGLHTLHCGFKAAVKITEWGIVEFLRALHYLFKDVPSRRADYVNYTESNIFPKKFCAIRWVENVDVLSRAIEILPNVKKYVECAVINKRIPSCKSFETVATAVKDTLLEAKLVFIKVLAQEVEPFLVKFQDKAPLAPYLYNDLELLIMGIAEKFIKRDALEKAPLTKIDLNCNANLKEPQNIKFNYELKAALKKIHLIATDSDKFKFKSYCRSAFKKLLQKLLERSPLKFKFTRAISVLDPSVFINKSLVSTRLSLCLETLIENNWITGSSADKIDTEFKNLRTNTYIIQKMESFTREKRLDDHWSEILSMHPSSTELKKFVQLLLILSHGNANVERGFSINKECIIENQSELSLVALRQVYDALQEVDDLSQLEISKSMIHAARNSHSLYVENLKRCKETEKLEIQKRQERKRKMFELKELEAKKRKIQTETVKNLNEVEKEIVKLRKEMN